MPSDYRIVKLVNPVAISGDVTMSGGIAQAASGNTAGTLSTISSGTAILAGGNNITLSQSQNTISIIGAAGGGGGGGSVYAGDNVTLSTNGASTTVSVTGLQSAGDYLTTAMQSDAFTGFMLTGERENYFYTSNNTFANSTHTHGNIAATNITATSQSNGLSLSVGNYLTTQSGQAFSASGGSSTFQTLSLADSNGITFSNTNGSLRITHDLQYTSNTSNITANAINTSQSSLFQHTSATSAITSAALHTSVSTKFAGTGTSATNATLTLNSNGLAISIGAGGAADGYNSAQFTNSTANSTMPIVWAGNSNGSGNITLGLTGSTVTGSAAGGGADGINALVVNGGASTSATTLTLSNSNNVTFGHNAGVITASASYSQSTAPAAIYDGANSISSGTVRFSNANGVSFGINGQTLTASHNGLTSQSNQALSGSNGSFTFQTASFGNSNGLSFYTTNGSMVGSYTVPTQSNQTIGGYFAGNTTGQSSSSTADARSISIDGAGIISAGWSNGSIRISATQSNQAFSADASSTFQTLSFQNSNGISFSNNAGALRITHALQYTSNTSAITASAMNTSERNNYFYTSNNTFANSTHTHGNVSLALTNLSGTTNSASNGLTLSLSANAPGAAAENNWFNLSGNTAGNSTASGSTIVLSAGNNVTLSGTNGSVIRIDAAAGGGGGVTLSGYDLFRAGAERIGGQIGQNTLYFKPIDIPTNVVFNKINNHLLLSLATGSTGSFTINQTIGIYTSVNSSQISLLTSFSGSTNFNHSGTANSASNSGLRDWQFTFDNYTITPGNYIFGFKSSTSSSSQNGATISNLIVSNMNTAFSGSLMAATNASNCFYPFQGSYSATTNNLPNSVALSEMRGSAAVNLRSPIFELRYY